MIPLRDSTRSRTFPVVTVALIAINLVVFFFQSLSSPGETNNLIYNYALIPARFILVFGNNPLAGIFHLPLLTAMFLHGGWFHVISNMLYLWIFGDNIEDRMGHGKFLFFYLLTGVIGSLSHVLTAPLSPVPVIGASGAVAGILGAYIVTFPHSRITSLIIVFFFLTVRRIPALFFILFWFFLQLINGVTSLAIMGSTVAWWAHIGGFVSGILLMKLFSPYKRYIY